MMISKNQIQRNPILSIYSGQQLRTGSSLNCLFNFDVTENFPKQWYNSSVKDVYARIARTFPGLNLNNNSLSKVVDTHDLISAWLLLRYVHQHYLVVYFSLFSLYARTTKRQVTRDSYTLKHPSLCAFCTLIGQFQFSQRPSSSFAVSTYTKTPMRFVCFAYGFLYLGLLYSIVSATFVLFLAVEPTLEETTFSF